MATPVRVGIIGANLGGGWGVRAHLPALAQLDGIEAVAVATRNVESAEATAAHFGVPLAFGDPRQLIEHPDVDVVAVCVRVSAHLDLVMQAIEAGKHVYCEWPLGRDTAEAQTMADAGARSQRVCAVGLQARISPAVRYARDLIEEGAIGTVRSAAFTHSRDWFSRPPAGFEYLNDRTTGSHFLSIPGGHSLDAMCSLLGEFEEMKAIVQTSLQQVETADGTTMPRTCPDQVLVAGKLENGVVGSFRLSGAGSPGTGVRLEISGDKGDLILSVPPPGGGFQSSHLLLERTVAPGQFETIAIPERYFNVPHAIRESAALNVGEAYLRLRDSIGGKDAAIATFEDAVLRHRSLDAIEQAAR